jgi:hypothetical protein
MAIEYAWSCTFCGGSNAAGTDGCANCGRPAITRGVDLEIAKGNPPRRRLGVIAVAKAYKRGLWTLFVAVLLLVLAVIAVEYFRPVNDRESFGFMILGASLPWSIAAFALPAALAPFGAIIIAAGIGINSVAAAIVILWWLRAARLGDST